MLTFRLTEKISFHLHKHSHTSRSVHSSFKFLWLWYKINPQRKLWLVRLEMHTGFSWETSLNSRRGAENSEISLIEILMGCKAVCYCALGKQIISRNGWFDQLTFHSVRPTFHCTNINPLKPELNPICYLLALLAHHFLHVSRIRFKSLTLRWLMSYIYGAPILDVSRSHTTTQHSR